MRYFAYGANLNLDSMAQRCPSAFPIAPASLPDHELEFYGVATVEPLEGSTAQGALWEITPRDLESLDIFEGFPTFYRREWVTVLAQTVDGEPPVPVEAICYFMNLTTGQEPTPPNPHYLGTILEGYADFGLDAEALRPYSEGVGDLLIS
tara:strand:- start:588 stop:1037 length:450 start_codon:yes stop_codon:yes gene_type:complete